MEKLIYLTFPAEGFDHAAYREQLLRDSAPAIISSGVRGLNMSFNDLQQELPEPMLLLGQGSSLGSVVSVWMDSLDTRAPVEAALASAGGRVDGYLVTESVPQACQDRDWSDGERSPGLTHFSWFDKAPEISDAEFFKAWFDVHTPFSFKLHPLRWEYVRNAVARPVTADAPTVRAIVVERFREIQDYARPERLFGSTELLQQSAVEAGDYCNPDTLNCVPLSEYILKTTR